MGLNLDEIERHPKDKPSHRGRKEAEMAFFFWKRKKHFNSKSETQHVKCCVGEIRIRAENCPVFSNREDAGDHYLSNEVRVEEASRLGRVDTR